MGMSTYPLWGHYWRLSLDLCWHLSHQSLIPHPYILIKAAEPSRVLSTARTSNIWVERVPNLLDSLRVTRFCPKVGQISPKLDKSGDLFRSDSEHFGSRDKSGDFFQIRFSTFWITDMKKKIPGFVSFEAKLTNYGPTLISQDGLPDCRLFGYKERSNYLSVVVAGVRRDLSLYLYSKLAIQTCKIQCQ